MVGKMYCFKNFHVTCKRNKPFVLINSCFDYKILKSKLKISWTKYNNCNTLNQILEKFFVDNVDG